MNEQKWKGRVEDLSIKPKTSGGEFVKLKISGKTFNLFNMELYEKNKEKFQMPFSLNVTFHDNEYAGKDGTKQISHIIDEIEFEDNPNQVFSQKTLGDNIEDIKEQGAEYAEIGVNLMLYTKKFIEGKLGRELKAEEYAMLDTIFIWVSRRLNG